MDSDYLRDIDNELAQARKRASDGVAASNFMNTEEGKLIQEWINTRVGSLLDKMSGKEPLSDREYLSAHGAIKELKDFNVMLQAKAITGQNAQEEVGILSDQRNAIVGNETPEA